jgi:hypothetical protein
MADLEQLLLEFIDANKTRPKQGTQEWKTLRMKTFGGSEISALIGENKYSSIKELIANKCGILDFTGNTYTRWGTMFENITKLYCERIFETQIYETSSIPGISGQSYSPDGIGIIKNKKHKKVMVLFEFKAPATKIPMGTIPECYVPQVMIGMTTIPYVSHCIFVNNMYRKCTYDQFLRDDESFDTDYHGIAKKPTKAEQAVLDDAKVYARGIIYFRSKCHWSSPADFSKLEKSDLNDVLEDQTLEKDYSNFCLDEYNLNTLPLLNNRDFPEFQTFAETLKLHTQTLDDPTVVGFLPWKLLVSDIIVTKKDPQYAEKCRPYIEKYLPILDRLAQIDSLDDRIDEFYKIFTDEGTYVDKKIKSKRMDSSEADSSLMVDY